MRVAVGSDHRGFDLKSRIIDRLHSLGHEATDLGPETNTSVDYPDFAVQVADAVASKKVDRGVLICGTGMGMCIAANKIRGIRATACHDEVTAEMSRRHNDANVLCLSAELLGEQLVDRMIEIWMGTEFEGGRHARRLEKISSFEKNQPK
ncbi:MAG: ribose 5-phosphate isomerase B [Planctomycetaceae bacterium]|nr:ribose 5-phosphate isomerase B [Planctomycetaceae bacterium]